METQKAEAVLCAPNNKVYLHLGEKMSCFQLHLIKEKTLAISRVGGDRSEGRPRAALLGCICV